MRPRALCLLAYAVVVVWAAWVGWMLGYAAGERDSLDRDPEPSVSPWSEKPQGWGVAPGVPRL